MQLVKKKSTLIIDDLRLKFILCVFLFTVHIKKNKAFSIKFY